MLGIHGGFPELLGGHFAQAFVALHAEIFLAFSENIIEQLTRRGFLNNLWFGGALLGHSFGGLLLGFFDVLALGVAELFAIAARRRGFWNRLDDKRRLKIRFDLLKFREQLAVFWRGGQLPVDEVLGALRVDVARFPKIVFFVEAALDFLELPLFLNFLQFPFQLFDFLWRRFLIALEVGTLGEVEFGQKIGDFFVAQALVNFIEEREIFVQHCDEFS